MIFPPCNSRRLSRPVQKHPLPKMLLIFAGKIIPRFVRDVNNLQKSSCLRRLLL
jgi:hypothetical protein